ncbi:MAG: carbohydrate ABC transporter permease, partial [Gammaproteobacteria bacterium]|nr:carbohydrate ABC transporter permease [Gammaproteobacteria bacterium]
MKDINIKFDPQNRSLMERLFEPPSVGKMAPVTKVAVYSFLAIWSFFVLFPI